MPELPEVETTLRGIKPHILGQTLTKLTVRCPSLRWPIPKNLSKLIKNRTLSELARRGKYLILTFEEGAVLLHLGMSGKLRVMPKMVPPQKHDHVDFHFSNHHVLRLTDPRRFGAVLWSDQPSQHPLLATLGPEPLSQAFTGKYLFHSISGRQASIKSLIMNSKIVVGVGNIYAAEALFETRIHPETQAKHLSLSNCQQLVKAIKKILRQAIKQGGTTLKDFMQADGKPGYFSIKLKVYGRGGKACYQCGEQLLLIRSQQRSTVYCPTCQPMEKAQTSSY